MRTRVKGDKGPVYSPGDDVKGPSRAVHPAAPTLPDCSTTIGICVILVPGDQGPVGDKGPIGDKGPQGEMGEWDVPDGPSRATHSANTIDPCGNTPRACRITLKGATGAKGPVGDKGRKVMTADSSSRLGRRGWFTRWRSAQLRYPSPPTAR